MRKVLPLFALLGLVACDLATDPVIVDRPGDLQQIATWSGTATGVAPTAGVTGTFTAADFGAFLEASVAISGAAVSTSYQWQLYRGTCAEATETPYGTRRHSSLQVYTALATDAAGSAAADITLAGPLFVDSTYYVRIGTAATNNRGVLVACGPLTRS